MTESLVSEPKWSEGSCRLAKVKFQGETEVQGQEFRLCLSANARGNGTVFISLLLKRIPSGRPGERAASLQKASENFGVLKLERLLGCIFESALEL